MGNSRIQQRRRTRRIPSKAMAAALETWRNNLIAADSVVDETRADVIRAIEDGMGVIRAIDALRVAKRNRTTCATHLARLTEWASEEAPTAVPLVCAITDCVALASRGDVHCAVHHRYFCLRRARRAA